MSKVIQAEAELLVADWNARVKPGDVVDYVEVRDDLSLSDSRYTVRTAAEVLGGHSAVVWLDGKAGCVLVTHCTPVPPAGQDDADDRDYEEDSFSPQNRKYGLKQLVEFGGERPDWAGDAEWLAAGGSLVFIGSGEWEALGKARAWCRDNDVATGPLQQDKPVGLMWGEQSHVISKWRNMSAAEQEALDGRLEGSSKRYGPVTITIKPRNIS